MKNQLGYDLKRAVWIAGLVLTVLTAASAGVDRFVIKDHPGGDGDYLNWQTAAPDIQSAIDAANAGDTIWVTNGVYDTGGTVFGATITTNRVLIDKAVTVRSVNGPAVTLIEGAPDPDDPSGSGIGLGPAAVRGVYMRSGSALIGFTVTNSATIRHPTTASMTHRGGGLVMDGANIVVSNCVIVGNAAFSAGGIQADNSSDCFVYDSVIANNRSIYFAGGIRTGSGIAFYRCTITGNHAIGSITGGVHGPASYYECLIADNQADGSGGGARDAFLYRCIVSNNFADGGTTTGGGILNATAYDTLIIHNTSADGGGAHNSTLYNCRIIENTANRRGGGVNLCTVYNSRLIGNRQLHTGFDGGGVRESTLYNTLIMGNEAAGSGGGTARMSELYNCTVTGNAGGGVDGGAGGLVINSIVWGNEDWNYDGTVVFTNSLTYPEQVGWAEGNITNAPIFFEAGSGGYGLDHVPGDYRLQSHSPGMNAGIAFDWMTEPQFAGDIRFLDLEGNPRIGRAGVVDMGAYEYVYVFGTIIQMR